MIYCMFIYHNFRLNTDIITSSPPHRFCRSYFCWHRRVQEPGKFLPCWGMPTHLHCLGVVPRGAAEMLFKVSAAGLKGIRGHFCSAILSTVSLNNMHNSRGACRAAVCEKVQMEDEHVYIVDVCLRRQFILMQVMYESKSSGGSKFPRIQYISLYFEFWWGKKQIFFQEIIRKISHSIFTHQGKQCLLPSSALLISKMT